MELITTTQNNATPATGRGPFRLPAANAPAYQKRAPDGLRKGEVALERRAVWSRVAGRRSPLEITIQEGLAILTFEGDLKDYVLGPGETFRTPGRGRVALSAYEPSRFTVSAA
jgi:hypothetical protein